MYTSLKQNLNINLLSNLLFPQYSLALTIQYNPVILSRGIMNLAPVISTGHGHYEQIANTMEASLVQTPWKHHLCKHHGRITCAVILFFDFNQLVAHRDHIIKINT